MIKLDIINEVVNRTGITKTKAEMAVETVFESMKRALRDGERIELRGFGIFN
ncbi:MAG TPA: HU family DNA-binding protein, partial [Bryobacteraceae bacterium]|nr:HU family DNA-binding protein [Bryobacteraceae bacterium]